MSNFSFLHGNTQYALFAPAAIEAEKVYTSAPAMCAVGCRKALELAVNGFILLITPCKCLTKTIFSP